MEWIQFIKDVGFPIAACAIIYWDLRRVVLTQSEAIQKLVVLMEQHINDTRRKK